MVELIGKTYKEMCQNFNWNVPEHFNIAVDACDRWAAEKDRLAVIELYNGVERKCTFCELKNLSNRLANALSAKGMQQGDRIGILLPQCLEALIANLTCYKMGCIAVPLLILFGTSAIEHRLGNSGAKVIITNRDNLPKVLEIKENLPALELIMVIQEPEETNVEDFWQDLSQGSPNFTPVHTKADDPAVIIYTSGTTGPPKGVLLPHRVLLGHIPCFLLCQSLFPREGAISWTNLDWGYIGGLFDLLFPSLYHGVPVLTYRATKFDPEEAYSILAKYQVTNLVTVPTVLKLMQGVKNIEQYSLKLRSIAVGGETMGDQLYQWGKDTLGVGINEVYGQTECNWVVGNCSILMKVIPGSMGKVVPGHTVEVIDSNGELLKPGEYGEIAVKRPDPVMFLGYWQDPEATKQKFIGDWLRTGDYGTKDASGYLWFTGREDDVIESSGYRIGPAEVEDCLAKHEAVSLAAVIGVPDKVRGEIVKAFIVPREGIRIDQALQESIKQHVKLKLEAHAYPREIEFIKELPKTATGKILRKDLRKREIEKRAEIKEL